MRWAVVDRGSRPHSGNAPTPGLRGLVDEVVERAHEVAGPAAHDGVANQRQRRVRDLAGEELGHHAHPCLDRQVPVGEGPAQGRGGVDHPGEPEEVVLERIELSGGHVLVERRGETRHARACRQQAERRLLIQPLGEVAHPDGEPVQGRRRFLGRHRTGREGGQTARLGHHLALEQVQHHGPACRSWDGGVAQRRPQLGVGHDELFDRFEVDRGGTQRGRAGHLGDGRRIALKRGVHWRAPAPAPAPAAAPPVVSARQRGDRLVDEVPVRLGVDLTADDPLDDLHDDLAHPRGRLLDRPLASQRDLDVGVAHDALVLALTPRLSIRADLLGRTVRGGHDLAGLLARLLEHCASLVVGRFGVRTSLVRRLQ